MHHKFVVFPFSAIVGQELMKKALLINAIAPAIGGVLIKGDKGTGKSTAVRALAHILPEIRVVKKCPFNCHPENLRLMCKSCQDRFKNKKRLGSHSQHMEIIDIPLSATEDMVVGTINIQVALKKGIKALEPGILARANRNILYIDEVNLLEDHLVNVLLDTAAMGINIIEREGISVYHPSRFILIGTMNPEEGDLRPQLLDRFGLCVEINALTDKEERLQVMKCRRDFDEDPWKFEKKYEDQERTLRMAIIRTKELFPRVICPQEMLEKIVKITMSLGVKTHRGDIVMEKAARAICALHGRTEVIIEDIKEAALLALPHRTRQLPFEKSQELTEELLESLLQDQDEFEQEELEFEKDVKLKRELLSIEAIGSALGKDSVRFEGTHGKYVRARENSKPRSVAIDATLRKSVLDTGKLKVLPEHLMEKVRISRGAELYILLLDSSSSMRLDKKIRFAKSLVWSLLERSYEKRNRVALLTFRGESTDIVVSPTSDVQKVEEALEYIPTGGKTPLTPAILRAVDIAKRERKTGCTIVLISDGRGNVFITDNIDSDIQVLSETISVDDIRFVFVNTEVKNRSLGVLENLSQTFRSPHFYLEDLI